jgi:diguanylate cyclase (GGDEF)-like protein/PAS domain S-box-containing protein
MSAGLDANRSEWWSETLVPPATSGASPNAAAGERYGHMGMLVVADDGAIADCCRHVEKILHGRRERIIGRALAEVLPDIGSAANLLHFVQAFRQQPLCAPEVVELTAVAQDGMRVPVVVSQVCLPSLPAGLHYFVIADATHFHLRVEDLQRLTTAIEQTGDAVAVTDATGAIEYVNRAFEEITGHPRAEVIGRSMSILSSGQHSQEFYASLWSTITQGRVFRARFANRRKNGELFYEEKTISPVRNAEGTITHFVSTAKDVTERVRAEEQLNLLANFDGLTRLPNRNLFMDRLRQAVAACARSGRLLALLYIDLDRFKLINDTLGHVAGDELLTQAAERLRACIREADTVARLGGDEFTVILTELASEADARKVLDKIMAAFRAAFRIQGGPVYVTPSIGISMCPADGTDVPTLLKHADVAMYHAKGSGRNGFSFFEPAMTEANGESLALETDLRGVLDRRELALQYQPQIDVATGAFVAVEALLRWHHPARGGVPPARFIPLLEDTGLIGSISEWVIETACRDMQYLSDALGADLQLAINLSTRQFKDPKLPGLLGAALARTGFDPARLEVEITESTLMADAPVTLDTIGRLVQRGIRIAVDDFGTGYSSLSYLRRFSVNTIKIDRSFVRDVLHDEDAAAIVKAIVSLGRDLEMTVVAEGVENYDQLAFLHAQRCSRAQGYFFSRPVSLDGIRELVERGVLRLRETFSPPPGGGWGDP